LGSTSLPSGSALIRALPWPTITAAELNREELVHSYYTFIALDLARDRAREAEKRRLLTIDEASNGSDRSIRRSVAAGFAALSRASGRVARRLDSDVAVLTNWKAGA
jgi:hypothetical protein